MPTHTATNSLIVSHLSVNYASVNAINDISFAVPTGKLIGIVGPNGAGKSTLMKALLNLIHSTHSGITYNNMPIKNIAKTTSYVKQRQDQDLTFPIRVKDVVSQGLYPSLGLFRYPTKQHKQTVHNALEQVEMETYANRQIGELSGGQLQRVFLARLIAQDAQLIFLDEPFVGIDAYSEQKIMHILKQMQQNGKTIIMVYHDLDKVTEYFDWVIMLNKELIAYGETEKTFTKANIARAYKSSLLDILKEVS